MAQFLCLFTLLSLVLHASALQVTPNSPCSSFCVDSDNLNFADPSSSNTKNKDIVCYDSEYQSSSAGSKFQQCLSCLQNSTYTQGAESDQLWFLYNLRYAVDYCVFGFPNATNVASTPCSTEKACGELKGALTGDLISSAKKPDYAFCNANGGVMLSDQVTKCHACVSASDDQDYLANYVVALDAGCQQQPSQGAVVGLSDTVFSKAVISTIDSGAATKESEKALSTPVIVGIGIGGAVVLLLIAGTIFVCCRRRHNRRLRLGDRDRPGRIPSHEYPISPLSFRCQATTSPYEPTPFGHSAAVTVEDFKSGHGPIDFAASPKMVEASAYEKPNFGGWQPQLPKSRQGVDDKNDRPFVSLNSLQTTNPIAAPSKPDNVHYAWSPQITRFSPVEDMTSPQSTTSTRSTTALLPLKPYNPSEWSGSPIVSNGGGFTAATPTMLTPTSGATASPLIGRAWDDAPPRKASLPIQGSATRQLTQTPSQQQRQESTKMETWGELPPRPNASPRMNNSNNQSNVKNTNVATPISVARSGAAAAVAIPPPKRRSSRAQNQQRYAGGVSPVEDSSIKTVFPGPPRR